MEGYEIIVALIIGLLVLAVVSVAFIPRLIESDQNSTQKLNTTLSSAIGAAAAEYAGDYTAISEGGSAEQNAEYRL